jgi:phosphosulfolactate phosphohydrolase-like enzyme
MPTPRPEATQSSSPLVAERYEYTPRMESTRAIHAPELQLPGVSGRELIAKGYESDVTIAAQLDSEQVTPTRRAGREFA